MKTFFFIAILLTFLTTNYYVALRLFQLTPPNLIVRTILISIIALCVGSLFVFFPLQKSLSFTAGGLLYRIGTAWMIGFLYFIILFVVIDLVKLSNNIFHFMDK